MYFDDGPRTPDTFYRVTSRTAMSSRTSMAPARRRFTGTGPRTTTTKTSQSKVWKFTVKFNKPGIGAGPFVGPAKVTLSYGPAIDRVGEVTDCSTSASGLVCRQLR